MKKEFNWVEFRNENIAVHCKTLTEAKDFCAKMHEQGMTWDMGMSYLEETFYDTYKEDTCYTGYGSYCDCSFFEEYEFTILEWSDFMEVEFSWLGFTFGKIVVHCPTKEDFEDFCKQALELEFKWCTGHCLSELSYMWYEDICLYHETGDFHHGMQHASMDYFESNGYKIFTWKSSPKQKKGKENHKLNKYMVYLEDSVNVYKIAVPAYTEEEALDYVDGNGEIIACNDVTDKYPISLDKVARALSQYGFGEHEMDYIIRALSKTGIAE